MFLWLAAEAAGTGSHEFAGVGGASRVLLLLQVGLSQRAVSRLRRLRLPLTTRGRCTCAHHHPPASRHCCVSLLPPEPSSRATEPHMLGVILGRSRSASSLASLLLLAKTSVRASRARNSMRALGGVAVADAGAGADHTRARRNVPALRARARRFGRRRDVDLATSKAPSCSTCSQRRRGPPPSAAPLFAPKHSYSLRNDSKSDTPPLVTRVATASPLSPIAHPSAALSGMLNAHAPRAAPSPLHTHSPPFRCDLPARGGLPLAQC